MEKTGNIREIEITENSLFIVVAGSGYTRDASSMSSFSLQTFIGSWFIHYDCSMYLGYATEL